MYLIENNAGNNTLFSSASNFFTKNGRTRPDKELLKSIRFLWRQQIGEKTGTERKKRNTKDLQINSKKLAYLCSFKKKSYKILLLILSLPRWTYSTIGDRLTKLFIKQLIPISCMFKHPFSNEIIKKIFRTLIVEVSYLVLTEVGK